MMLCHSRGLNPWEGDAFIIGYDGKDGPEFALVTAHQAYLKRAEMHPEFDGMESGVVVKRGEQTVEYQGDMVEPGDTFMGAWAKVYFKKRTYPVYRRCQIGKVRKPFGLWNSQPEMMCVKTAESDALRSAFPNTYGGMSLEQILDGSEDYAAEISAVPVTPGRGKDSHPEPPPFDRAAVLRSIETQRADLAGQGMLSAEAWIEILGTWEAVKVEELADEQLGQLEEQLAEMFRKVDPARPLSTNRDGPYTDRQ